MTMTSLIGEIIISLPWRKRRNSSSQLKISGSKEHTSGGRMPMMEYLKELILMLRWNVNIKIPKHFQSILNSSHWMIATKSSLCIKKYSNSKISNQSKAKAFNHKERVKWNEKGFQWMEWSLHISSNRKQKWILSNFSNSRSPTNIFRENWSKSTKSSNT